MSVRALGLVPGPGLSVPVPASTRVPVPARVVAACVTVWPVRVSVLTPFSVMAPVRVSGLALFRVSAPPAVNVMLFARVVTLAAVRTVPLVTLKAAEPREATLPKDSVAPLGCRTCRC